jgi:hypothetical protein
MQLLQETGSCEMELFFVTSPIYCIAITPPNFPHIAVSLAVLFGYIVYLLLLTIKYVYHKTNSLWFVTRHYWFERRNCTVPTTTNLQLTVDHIFLFSPTAHPGPGPPYHWGSWVTQQSVRLLWSRDRPFVVYTWVIFYLLHFYLEIYFITGKLCYSFIYL